MSSFCIYLEGMQISFIVYKQCLHGLITTTRVAVVSEDFLTDLCELPVMYCLVDIFVKASASRAENLGFDSCLRCGNFSGSSHTSDFKIGTPVATCQAPSAIGPALGLVGPVSVYCDWVR